MSPLEQIKKVHAEWLQASRTADALKHKMAGLEQEVLLEAEAPAGHRLNFQTWEVGPLPGPGNG